MSMISWCILHWQRSSDLIGQNDLESQTIYGTERTDPEDLSLWNAWHTLVQKKMVEIWVLMGTLWEAEIGEAIMVLGFNTAFNEKKKHIL